MVLFCLAFLPAAQKMILQNLTHRTSHEHPEPLEPGRRYTVRLQLNDAAHAFPAETYPRTASNQT